MNRTIDGYHQDAEGDWVAELSCGHNQHVRHRPPFQERPWVLTPTGRHGRLGTPLPCPLCERAELPEAIRQVRSSPEWDEHSMPAGIRRLHRLAPDTWGVIRVHRGLLRFSTGNEQALDVQLGPGSSPRVVPPGVVHQLEPSGSVRFSIDFFVVDRSRPGRDVEPPNELGVDTSEQGGDPACWAGLLCPECGAVLADGRHREGCSVSMT
jgi:tellurite methyltransferase